MDEPLGGKRLLVVDENADLARLVGDAAARLGAEVDVRETGRAALDALGAGRPDAAVLDLPLADVRGSEVIAALAAAGVPAVAVSGVYRGARAAAEVRRLGAADFFEKPFPVEALMASLARLVGRDLPAPGEALDEVTGSTPLREAEATGISAGLAAALADLRARPSTPGPADGLAAPAPAPAPPRARPAGAPAPARQGDLGQTSVPRLLVALHVAQATGALTLSRGPVRKIVVVERGRPVYAASNVAGERFGAICVRLGLVAQEWLDAARRDEPGARTGDLLVRAGLLSPARRAELVAGQVKAIAWSTFDWREGGYAFQLARPPEGRVPLAVDAADVVLDGVLRTSTLPRLREELPADLHLAPAPDPAFELFALRLGPAQAQLLALADGTKSVADLVALSDLAERDALAFLHACRVMRILDEVERVLASTRRIGFM